MRSLIGNRMAMCLYILMSVFILVTTGCKTNRTDTATRQKRIVIRTFTGNTFSGWNKTDRLTNWYYIKTFADDNFAGYYFKSNDPVNDFHHVKFTYSINRPGEFEAESASGEKIQFIDPDELPDDIVQHLEQLESLIVKKG